MGKLIGVVTVTFNSDGVIRPFMDSILEQDYEDFRLYIVDNHSADATLVSIAEYRDTRIVVLANRENVGVAEGNNIGIRAAIADGCGAVLLINNDTVFGCDLLSSLYHALNQHACEMVAPKIVYFDNPRRIYSAGGFFSRVRKNCKHFGGNESDRGHFNAPRFVKYSPTCCLLIAVEVFQKVGFMDEVYFVYYDDADFCYRAYRRGVKLFYYPRAEVLHKVSSLTGSVSEFSTRYTIRNRVYFALKFYPLVEVIPFLLVFQLVLILRWVMRRPAHNSLEFLENAFWEGISLFASQRPPKPASERASVAG